MVVEVRHMRNAMFELPQGEDYRIIFNELLEQVHYYGHPCIAFVTGAPGTGKTRMLKGLQAVAASKPFHFPTTYIHTSDYRLEETDFLHSLLIRMGKVHASIENEDTDGQAVQLADLLATVDAAASLLGKPDYIGRALSVYDGTRAKVLSKLLGNLLEEDCDSVVNYVKKRFAKMVNAVCAARKEQFGYPATAWFVFIDDIDRMPETRTLDVLETCRAIFSGVLGAPIPPVVFMLGIDEERLRAELANTVAQDNVLTYDGVVTTSEGDLDASERIESLLEQLFVLRFRVPMPTKAAFMTALGASCGNEKIDSVLTHCADRIGDMAVTSHLTYRTLLRAIDRTRFILKRHASTWAFLTDMNTKSNMVEALFFLQLCYGRSLRFFRSVCAAHAQDRGRRVNDFLLGPSLSAELTALRDHVLHESHSDESAWETALDLCAASQWR